MESSAASSFGDLAESVFQTEELFSALISPTVDGITASSDHRKTGSNETRIASSEVHESQRQRRVELELYHKVTNLRHSLLDFGETQGIRYVTYGGEHHLKEIMDLITKDLSEPYSIYTYRYFIYQWPKLCYLAMKEDGKVVGTIVCKMENTKGPQVGRSDYIRRGYIAMLAVDKTQRRKKIGTALVVSAVEALMMNGCDEVVLETETTNQAALHLYENLGFAKHKRLLKYYLNGVDAFRLKLWIKYPAIIKERATGPKEEMNNGTAIAASPSVLGDAEEI